MKNLLTGLCQKSNSLRLITLSRELEKRNKHFLNMVRFSVE